METIKKLLDDSVKLSPARDMEVEKDLAMPEADVVHGARLYSLEQLMAHEFPPDVWVVEDLIPEGVTILSAEPRSFKTWLLLDVATCVASGQPLFGTLPTTQSGILIIDEENGAKLLQQRLRLLQTEQKLPIHLMIESNFKLDAEQVSRAIKICQEYGVGLVMFDSLVRIHTGNENDATAMAQVFAGLRRFTKAGISVLVTHHNRKSKSDNAALDMRGSSDILAAVDCHIAVRRDEGNRLVLTQTKLRIAPESDPMELQVVSDKERVRFEYLGLLKPAETKKVRTLGVIADLLQENGEMNKKELLAELSELGLKTNPKTLKQYLDTLLEAGTVVVSSGVGNEKRYELNV